MLYEVITSGITTIEKYKNEPPYAYFIPQKQRDNMRPVELLRRLAFNGIRISQLNQEVAFDGVITSYSIHYTKLYDHHIEGGTAEMIANNLAAAYDEFF